MTRLLHSFSLVVTDRRWAAPLSACALGFGLFIGVAIGPSAAGTLAGDYQIVEIPNPGGDEGEGAGEAGGSGSLAGPSSGGAEGEAGALGALPAPAPLVPVPAPEPAPAKPAPKPKQPADEAPDDEATELVGVVAHANPAAGSYALAVKGGELVPVHAKELPVPGAKLTVLAEPLANGTFAEQEKPQRNGAATTVTFTGLVTYAAPDVPGVSPPYGRSTTGTSPGYTVSGRGASLLVNVDPDPTGAEPELPALGAYVAVTAAIESPEEPPSGVGPAAILVQREIEVEPGEPSTYLDLAGIVGEEPTESGQLLLSADDTRESEADLVLDVASGIDVKKLAAGDSYLATAEVREDGSLTLMGIASDEHRRGADDAGAAQGDLKR